jgi:hypothetical protein
VLGAVRVLDVVAQQRLGLVAARSFGTAIFMYDNIEKTGRPPSTARAAHEQLRGAP